MLVEFVDSDLGPAPPGLAAAVEATVTSPDYGPYGWWTISYQVIAPGLGVESVGDPLPTSEPYLAGGDFIDGWAEGATLRLRARWTNIDGDVFGAWWGTVDVVIPPIA
jgi:hypothetical protein